MGKAKPVTKKAVQQSHSKISTSLFQRKSKTSQGAGLVEGISSMKALKKAAGKSSATTTPKSKQGKAKESNSGTTAKKATLNKSKGSKDASPSSSTTTPKKGTTAKPKGAVAGKKSQEKRPSSPVVETKGGKNKEKAVSNANANTKKGKVILGKVGKGTPTASKGKAASQKKRFSSSSSSASSSTSTTTSSSSSSSPSSSDGEKSTRANSTAKKKVAVHKRKSRDSREDDSPSPTTRLRSPDSDKVTTRKRYKSDSESPPPQKLAKVGEKKNAATKNKKGAAQSKSTGTTKTVAKKVAKKAVASIVASKKKTVVKKPEKSSTSTSTKPASSSGKAKESSSTTTAPSKDKKKNSEIVSSSSSTSVKSKPSKVVKVKQKAKPKTKIKVKRMASLNAKAILEASFSFEPSEKKQRSPAPQSSSSTSISTSTSTTPQNKVKSTASTSTSTDELTSKGATGAGSAVQDIKPSTSSSSTSTLTSSTGTSTSSKSKEASPSPKKKKDVAVVAVCSVSTSTSPTPPEIPEPKTFKSNPVSVKSEKKQRKSTDQASSGSSTAAVASRRESVSSTKSSSRDTQTATFSPSNSPISVGTSCTQTSGTSGSSGTPLSKKKEKSSAEAGTQGKAGSRRSSTAASTTTTPTNSSTDTSTSTTGKSKEKGAKSPNPKKKQKMVAAATTTSTSTSTSPIPTMWNECDVASEKRAVATQPATTASVPKQKKKRSESSGGRDKVQQDSSSQVQQGQLPSHHQHSTSTSSKHKSASYQTKEKSSTPVAHYGSGTVYQPAGPLIEPHKQSSVPAGILPETVRLPPDLKVTYQTHPPSSAFMVSSPPESQQQHQHHHHHHHHHSPSTTATKSSGGSSSSKSYKSSSSSHKSSEKSSSSSSAGTILHQPYKSTPSAASSPSLSRNVPSSFSSAGSGYASSSGTPLLSPSEQSTLLSHHHHQQQQPSSASAASAHHGSHHQQGSSGTGSISAHPLHSVTPGGSITLGGSAAQHAQTQNPGAPSSTGLFYTTTNYGHSPFAQVKYPIVPPESYRTQSPFPNSFLCPPTTPQPSQSYFMTPFYTPPLTPNPTPGLGTVGPNQGRPLSALTAAAAHHPSAAAAAAAAAAAYYQQGGALSQQPPAPYYMPSPQHHSIHPSPAAPGHAGPFRPNQSSQPACPFPTESYQPSSNCTNNNIRPPPLQQRPSLSSGSLPAPEAGAKQPKPKSSTSPALVSVTASRPSRNNKETLFHHPPTCITPAVAADPPSSIQIMPVSTNTTTGGDARQQLESAKTFTEQYSLPDDITITPILPPNPPPQLNPALLMLNSSVSVMLTSAPSTTTTTMTTTTSKSTSSTHDGLLKTNNSFNHMPSKPKEKDIVHVIDPRSGQRTTIAKHISNNSRIAGNFSDINKNRTKIGRDSTNFAGSVGGVGKGPGMIQQRTSNSRMETVRKLNPDLDVIVINNSGGDMHGNRNDKTENIQTMNLSSVGSSPATNLPEKPPRSMTGNHQGNPLKTMPPLKAGGRMAPNKTHPVPFSAISSSVMGIAPGSSSHHQQGKRVALAHSDNNNFHRNNSGNNNANNSANSILRVNQKKSKGQRNSLPNTSHFPQQSVYPHIGRSPPSSTASVSSQLPHNHNQYAIPSLPAGISISAGSSSGIGGPIDNMQPTNLSKKNYGNVMTSYRQPQQQVPVNMTYHQPKQKNVKAIKRSLNECIDGLQLQHQQKKLKLLEQQHAIMSNGNRGHNMGNGNPLSASTSARTGIFNVNGGKPIFSGTVSPQQQQILFQQQQQQFRQHQQQFVAGNMSNKLARQQQQQFLQNPVFGTETATAARVRGPNFEQKVGGGMVINSNDAMTAVSALVVEPFDYSLAGRQQAYNAIIHNNGLASRGRKEKAVGGRPLVASSYQAYTEAKKKVNKMKGRQHVGEKHQAFSGGRGAIAGSGAGGAKSKIRTRLSVKPKGLHHNTQQPLGSRSRSRLLRKRSLLCNPNSNNNSGNRKSESDGGSVCASRSSSSVRIISGGAQQNGGKGGKERERERPKHTQAFINATADLYQYRRRLILRVPSAKPAGVSSSSVSSSATAVSNLNRAIPMGADAIARFGDLSSSSPSSSSLPIELASTTKSEIPREVAAQQMHQIAFSHILGNQHQSPMSLAVQESKGPSLSPLPRTGSMVVNAMKKRAGMKPLSPASVNGALTQQLLLNSKRQPRWSNGWTFEGEPYEAKVYVKNDDMPITRRCYPSMRHDGGDVIRTRDCVLLKSGPRKNDLPFIAKIAALWENPADGEMMFSLLWYYRPEHTELGRTKDDMMDEIFASKHRDTNSVATIEDRCYVLTFNEYCRYRKRLKQLEQGIQGASMVPFADTAMINTDAAAKIAESVWSGRSVDSSSSISSSSSSKSSTFQGKVSPEVIFFCRKVYDFRQKRILKNPS